MHCEEPTIVKVTCYHCGDSCDRNIIKDDKSFCCFGCKTVFEILHENGLDYYYNLESNPGTKQIGESYYTFLEEPSIREKVLDFDSETLSKVTFMLPAIHCSSCVYLLERLSKIHTGIQDSRIDFVNKEISISYNPGNLSLREIAELLSRIGYKPDISLNKQDEARSESDSNEIIRMGVSGFLFGNIMLLTFPEYFGLQDIDVEFKRLFTYLIGALSIPVFFYCASVYFVSAYKGLREKYVNLDVPIALGILTLFLSSWLALFSSTEPGYFDSMAGLVFFLSIGRWLQAKTYKSLSFDRDYKSYFPLAVLRLKGTETESTLINELKVGDLIKIRNHEVIPGDSVLLSEQAYIDYSFVTGEELAVEKKKGELIYAGGRQIGAAILLELKKESSSSFLTQLWNDRSFEANNTNRTLIDTVSKYFTISILIIAIGTALVWWFVDQTRSWEVLAAVLIVACPCALAMSTPFTFGSAMAILGRNKFYIKNISVIEKLEKIKAIVFDKTGTITKPGASSISYSGEELTSGELASIRELASSSLHPLSQKITAFLKINDSIKVQLIDLDEVTGKGLNGVVNGNSYKLGSADFVGSNGSLDTTSKVFVSINGIVKGSFGIKAQFRNDLTALINKLNEKYALHLLSGDNEAEQYSLKKYFPDIVPKSFNQLPNDKLNYVKRLQEEEINVMMIGDGLNDAGALRQSDVGISVSDNSASFSPACDVIIDGEVLIQLDTFLRFAKSSVRVVKFSYLLSILYNVFGLSLAISGNLTPIYAAILMPFSSISVILFTTGTMKRMAHKYKLN